VKQATWLTFLLPLLLSGGVSPQQDVLANTSMFYVKASHVAAIANQDIKLEFFITGATDLFGIQIDIATSLNQGALPLEPTNKTNPFEMNELSLFHDDLVLFNKYDATKEVTSLLVTRQLSETSGYAVNKVKLITSIQLKALMNLPSVTELIKVSDDLLSMQLGITSITVKLSTSVGQKISYSMDQADTTRPTINLLQSEKTVSLNESFTISSVFTVSDNRSLVTDLLVQTSSFHTTEKEGEYLITILVADEFQNFTIRLFKLMVGNPYTNIEVNYVNA
jgi:hypothetical protein